MAKEILEDLPASPLSFVAGGSVAEFESQMPGYKQLLPQSDFVVIHDYNLVPQNKNAKRIALIADKEDTALKAKGRGDFLPATTRYAIDYLSSKQSNGFFLMVEGAQIDGAGHSNDLESVVLETLDFDKAVAEALKFADADGNTLVLVTADHETGGMSITGGNMESSEIQAIFTTKGHTPVMVPLFAYGPGSTQFKGVMENTEIMKKILFLIHE